MLGGRHASRPGAPGRRWAAAALLAGCLGLTACQGYPGEPANPSPSPSVPASPSPSMSPSPSPSPSPSAPATIAATVELVHDPDIVGQFDPQMVTIPVGGTVQWVWNDKGASGIDAVPHNVTGPDFASETMTEGTFTHTFTQAGLVMYVCDLHPGMEGEVNVTAR